MENKEKIEQLIESLKNDKNLNQVQKDFIIKDFNEKLDEINEHIFKGYQINKLTLSKLQLKSLNIYNEIKNTYPDWIKNKDARSNVFGKFISQINSQKLSFHVMHNYIDNNQWIEKFEKQFCLTNIFEEIVYFEEFDKSCRFSFFQQLFADLESTIKVIARHLNKRGAKKFKENYFGFICNDLAIKQNNDNFLKLIKWTRNSIHNNGMHYPDSPSTSNSNFDLQYKNIICTFKFEHKIEFLTWPITFAIAEDIIDLMKEILLHNDIVNENYIEDPVEKV